MWQILFFISLLFSIISIASNTYSVKAFRVSYVDLLVIILAFILSIFVLLSQPPPDYRPVYLFSLSLTLYLLFREVPTILNLCYEKIMIAVVSCAAIGEATLGILQALSLVPPINTLFPITGSFLNPGPFGCFSAATGTVSTVYVLSGKNWSNKELPNKLLLICTCLAALLSICIVCLIKNRTAILGYSICLIVFFLKNTRSFKRTKKIIVVIVCILILLPSLYYAKKPSSDGRILIYKVSTNALFSTKFIGAGFGNFKYAFGESQSAYFSNKHYSQREIRVAGSPRYAFNEYIQLGVETGAGPMLLFIVITILSVFVLIKHNSYMAYGLISIATSSLFSYPLQTIPILILFVIYLSYASYLASSIVIKSIHVALVSAVGCIVSVLTILPYSNYINALKKLEFAQTLLADGLVAPAVIIFDSISNDLSSNEEYLFTYGHLLHRLGHFEKSNTILSKGAALSDDPMFHNIIGKNYAELGLIDNAEKEYTHAINMLPNRQYPYYLLSLLYYNNGMIEEFQRSAIDAIELKPKIPSHITDSLKRNLKLLLYNINTTNSHEDTTMD